MQYGMNGVLLKIIPIILIFILGFLLKRINVLKKEGGDLLLKLVFYVSLPALIIISVANISLSPDFIYLPIIAVLVAVTTFFASSLLGKFLGIQRKSFGVFLIGTMIMNIGFILPFIIAAYGDEGLARLSLFDFGNGFLTFTFTYYIACRYGDNKRGFKTMAKKFILSPPLWALIIAVLVNLSGLKIPGIANNFFHAIGNLTIPMVMLSLGAYFSPKIAKIAPLSLAAIIRMFFGLLLGFFFARLFNLEGLNRIIALIGSAAPIGYNTITFSSLENLDKEFAANLVSFSILIGIVLIPLLMILLS